jgi:hypothetical protein
MSFRLVNQYVVGKSPYSLIWLRDELCIMYIEMINKNENRWLRYERDDNDGGGL